MIYEGRLGLSGFSCQPHVSLLKYGANPLLTYQATWVLQSQIHNLDYVDVEVPRLLPIYTYNM